MKQSLLGIFLLCTMNVFSQNIKIGYINSLELVSIMPETKAADSAVLKLAQELDAVYKEYIKEYQTKYVKLNDASISEEMKGTISQDLQYLETRIKDYEQTSQDKVNNKRAELYQPILEKATKAVQATAKENGYTHVLDSSNGVIIYAPEGDNILALVKKKLNIK